MKKLKFEIGIMNTSAEHSYRVKEIILKNETHKKLLKIAAYWGIPTTNIISISIEAIVKELWDKEENRPSERRGLID